MNIQACHLRCLFVLVGLLTTHSWNSQSAPPPPAGIQKVDVALELGTVVGRMRYDINILEAAPGSWVKLTLKNTDIMQHNWVLCRPGKDTAMEVAKLAWALGADAIRMNYVPESSQVLAAMAIVNPGQNGSVLFQAPLEKGAYPFVCTLPGHAMTMQGVLYVGITPPKPKTETKQVARVDFPASGVERAKQQKRRYLPFQDSGRVFCGTLFLPDTQLPPVTKGIALRIGEQGEGGGVFDPDLMRMSVGWLGRFIETNKREDETAENRHKIGGQPIFVTDVQPGCAEPETGSLQDPRSPLLGPLPHEWARYKGMYLSGDRAVLKYTVGKREILESPWLESADGHMIFTRSFQVSPSDKPSRFVLCSAPSAHDFVKREAEGVAIFKMGDYAANGLAVAIACTSSAAELQFADLSRLVLAVPASQETQRIKVFLSRIHHNHLGMFGKHVKASEPDDLTAWTRGGAERWTGEVVTQGERATAPGEDPYVVDTLTLPYDNPWNALMYASGHDFFSNGDAAVCMSHGDVWILRGIDDSLERLRWKRFAAGLSSPLGLKIVGDVVHVTCHDQITRLHDLNGDGEADYYENFNNDCQVTRAHHRFATNLDTDPEGNFYYTKCSEESNSDHGGTMIRISPDGERFEVFATGLRNPNGMAISPDGIITFGKQQGGWVPSSGIDVVRQGGFYGYMPSHHQAQSPTTFENPLCWIPHGVDNSSGGQAWAPKDDSRWGPLAGSLLHFSYGKCSMFVAPYEVVNGQFQGAVVPLPGVGFRSSAMRARFRPTDGQLYVSGLRGWQTSAQYAGTLDRVRYTGKPLYLATGFHVEPDGIRIGLSQPLDRETAADPARYQVHQWNYRWTKDYGSRDYSVKNPEKEGRDAVEITAAQVSSDGRSVLLKFAGVQPVMQIQIQAELVAADGHPLHAELYGTVNAVPQSSH